jgi:hypothetical protein
MTAHLHLVLGITVEAVASLALDLLSRRDLHSSVTAAGRWWAAAQNPASAELHWEESAASALGLHDVRHTLALARDPWRQMPTPSNPIVTSTTHELTAVAASRTYELAPNRATTSRSW